MTFVMDMMDETASSQPQNPNVIETAAVAQPARDQWEGFFSLDPRGVSMERMIGLITAGVLTLVAAVALLCAALFWLGLSSWWWLLMIVAIVFSLSLFWLAWIWPAKEHRMARWKCDDVALEIHRGVWWRQRITVPLSRIQHVDVGQGPVQRRYGLARFTVYTAGTQNASVELSNIAWETAHWLRDRLMSEREVIDAL